MERSDGGADAGEISAKRTRISSDSSPAASEDRLSALPDEVLVLVLLRLQTAAAAAAARTSVLSRRWRRVWALLPELRFPVVREPSFIRDILESHEAALRFLHVGTLGAAPDSLAAWLPAAARRLSGRLVFCNRACRNAKEEGGEGEAKGCAFELPCFGNATSMGLDLGLIGLSVPPAGVFARLTELRLHRVSFHSPWELGDAVSSPRCPCLQKLAVHDCRGLNHLAVHSGSLLQVDLNRVLGLRQLIIVAPALEELGVSHCFFYDWNQSVASISATQLVSLDWRGPYDPGSVDLGAMECVQWLTTSFFPVYGHYGLPHNWACLKLLERFKVIEGLTLTLAYVLVINDMRYMMDDMTVLPDLKFLHLMVLANGYAFGASTFHVLRMCSGLRRLRLSFLAPDSEAQSACQSGCVCGQQSNWKTDELLLNRLEEVEIVELKGSEHEIAFLKRLLSWATLLKRITITFKMSVSKSMADELRQMLLSFSRPEICMEFKAHLGIFKALCEKEG